MRTNELHADEMVKANQCISNFTMILLGNFHIHLEKNEIELIQIYRYLINICTQKLNRKYFQFQKQIEKFMTYHRDHKISLNL